MGVHERKSIFALRHRARNPASPSLAKFFLASTNSWIKQRRPPTVYTVPNSSDEEAPFRGYPVSRCGHSIRTSHNATTIAFPSNLSNETFTVYAALINLSLASHLSAQDFYIS